MGAWRTGAGRAGTVGRGTVGCAGPVRDPSWRTLRPSVAGMVANYLPEAVRAAWSEGSRGVIFGPVSVVPRTVPP